MDIDAIIKSWLASMSESELIDQCILWRNMALEHGLMYSAVEAKNARLREQIDAAHMSRLLTEDENEKLRELCVDLHKLADESYVPFMAENKWMDELADIERRMQELGIEVDQ